MTVRDEMIDLIEYVRKLMADTEISGNYSDEEIQRELDMSRERLLNYELIGAGLADGSDPVQWSAEEINWDKDIVLTSMTGKIVTPLTSDELAGTWTLSAGVPYLYATGWVYDPFRAAANLVERYAYSFGSSFDFSADGASFNLSQKRTNLMGLANDLRRRARMQVVRQVRNDAIE